jgi:hypothetical protein
MPKDQRKRKTGTQAGRLRAILDGTDDRLPRVGVEMLRRFHGYTMWPAVVAKPQGCDKDEGKRRTAHLECFVMALSSRPRRRPRPPCVPGIA